MRNLDRWFDRAFNVGLVVLVVLLLVFGGNKWDDPNWVRGGLIPILIIVGIVVAAIGAFRNRVK